MRLSFIKFLLPHGWQAGLVMVFAALFANPVQAASCISNNNGGGEWLAASTWTCDQTPTSSDDVTVLSGDTVTITKKSEAGTVTVDSGGTLLIGIANTNKDRTLVVDGNMSVGGTFKVTNTSSGHHMLDINGSLAVLAGGQLSQQDDDGWGLSDVYVHGDFSNAGTYAIGINGPDLIIDGKATNSGSLNGGSEPGTNIMVGGDFTNTPAGAFDAGSARLTFNGGSAQAADADGTVVLGRVTVDNASGVTLVRNLTAVSLALTSGTIATGSNILTVSSDCTAGAVTRGSGYVLGNLRLTFPAGTHNCTFYIGSSNGYAPLGLKVSASGGGTLSASTSGNEHPQIAASAIDPANDANRYWTLGTSGDTLASKVTSYGATFNFSAGDLDSTASAVSFIVAKYAGGIWSAPAPVTANSLSTGVSGVTGPISAATDFALGDVPACQVPSGLPNNMTCVCDNFGRTSLNPSTIYGGNWSLSSSGGSFGLPRIVNSGYLQMTDNTQGAATAATMPGIFPAAGNLIQIEFRHYAYKGSGADGIALTLSDASLAPVPGAFGGSLGYAQKAPAGVNGSDCTNAGGCPGFAGGWVGIALDEYGGFSANTEGRTGGTAPGSTPDAVAIRGSGSAQTGYPYLAGTISLSPGIDNPGSADPADGYLYRIKVDARDYTSGNKTTTVSVDRDIGDGNGYQSLVTPFDAFAANSSQAAVPASWKLSFTGSTGSLANIHEIGALKVCAQTIMPPAGYRIQVDNPAPSTCGTPGGTPSSPAVTVTALDTNGDTVTDYKKTVTLFAALSDGNAAGASWSLKRGYGTLSGNQYTFVAADQGSAQFYLTDTHTENVFITISENDGTLSSSTLGMAPIQFSGGTFQITTADSLGDALVAGRPHMMQVTRSTCSGGTNSIDEAYSAVKMLDGWYQPDQDHPAGAIAPSICALNACLPATGACQSLSIAAPNADAGQNNIALAFDHGVANFCLGTSDVGKYSVFLRDDSNVPKSAIVGSSKVLTARPFAVGVFNVTQSSGQNSANNPAISSPAPNEATPVFTTAGSNFSATVSGYLWNSSGDLDGNGYPDAAADWSQITGGGIASHYADTVELRAITPFAPATPSDWPSGVGTAGVLTGSPVMVTGGSTTQLSLAYSEVGSFSLYAMPAKAYLHTSDADLSRRAVVFANPSLSTRSRWVGRFKPDHFELAEAEITPRSDIAECSESAFTYMGEPMHVRFSLEAHGKSGITKNYAGAYAHLAPDDSAWVDNPGAPNTMGFWMVANGYTANGVTCNAVFSRAGPTAFQACSGPATPASVPRTAGRRVTLSGAPVDWNAGSAVFDADVVLERADTPDGPYNQLRLGIDPRDAEDVTLPAYGLDAENPAGNERALLGTAAVRYGRLLIPNMYGSELLQMPINVQAQYWSGAAYINNADDNCTSLAADNFALSNPVGGIAATSAVSILDGTTLSGGAGMLGLSKPAPITGKGSVTLRPVPTLNRYLPGSGVETFGLYRGGRVIYLREGHY